MCVGNTVLIIAKLVSHGVAPSILVHTLQYEMLSGFLCLIGTGNCVW